MTPRAWTIVQIAAIVLAVISFLSGGAPATEAIVYVVALLGEDVAKMREEQAQRIGKERIHG